MSEECDLPSRTMVLPVTEQFSMRSVYLCRKYLYLTPIGNVIRDGSDLLMALLFLILTTLMVKLLTMQRPKLNLKYLPTMQ